MNAFTLAVIENISKIPKGRISTYGRIAELSGNPRASRQVSRILSTMSSRYQLPWHRVINSQGRISLKPGMGYEEQRRLLEDEGIEFDLQGKIDLKRYII
ncbi:MGMT family protein [Fusibacter ferrireducens]|uniref:MGMT family protein n=1 Tax=Fusibacter ferrireducens TaxID=2785058 RepID=A0ABR9ZZX0_9FIRM|nr:MGMT family protein [Fusibacter ferrireducens]MBF4696002.1 MGMT family protein [Fusibacter ferrireducens]